MAEPLSGHLNEKETIRPADWEGRMNIDTPLARDNDYHFPGYGKQQGLHDTKTARLETAPRRPAWMRLLPSNVNPHVKPPSHSALQRRSTFPYIEHTRWSPSNLTPPRTPKASQQDASRVSIVMQSMGEMSSPQPTRQPGGSNDPISILAPQSTPRSARRQSLEAKSIQSPLQPVTTVSSTVGQKPATTTVPEPTMIDHNQRPPNKLQKRLSARDRSWKLSVIRQPSVGQSTMLSDNASAASTLSKLSIRRHSTNQDVHCDVRPHTPVPSQDITPARQPFFKEMLSYFTIRANAGKQILPSRISEVSGRVTPEVSPLCLSCGKPIPPRADLETEHDQSIALRCQRCRLRSSESKVSTSVFGGDLPGAWSPGRS